MQDIPGANYLSDLLRHEEARWTLPPDEWSHEPDHSRVIYLERITRKPKRRKRVDELAETRRELEQVRADMMQLVTLVADTMMEREVVQASRSNLDALIDRLASANSVLPEAPITPQVVEAFDRYDDE